MRTKSTRKLRGEILEPRTMLTHGLDAAALSLSAPTLNGDLAPCVAQFGDANVDGLFDEADLVKVLQSARYGTGQPATFEEGDWNGDNVFDQHDIIAASQSANYLTQSDGVKASCDTITWEKTLDPLAPGAVWKGTGTTNQDDEVTIRAYDFELAEDGDEVKDSRQAQGYGPRRRSR